MMKKISYEVILEKGYSLFDGRRMIDCHILKYKDKDGEHRQLTYVGKRDEYTVYQDDEHTYALVINRSDGFAGLQIFSGSAREGSVYLYPSRKEIKEGLLQLGSLYLVEMLKEIIMENYSKRSPF